MALGEVGASRGGGMAGRWLRGCALRSRNDVYGNQNTPALKKNQKLTLNLDRSRSKWGVVLGAFAACMD